MANLELLADEFRKEGYSDQNAEARVCQDIVLKAIAESNLSRNVTIKGGVVMRSITGNIRRATQDMDLDFIRYSLNEDAIRQFIDKLNCLEGIFIKITGKIEELSQQEYRGKRVYVVLEDDTGHSFKSKIDLGVHKNIQVAQDEYCFDVCLDTIIDVSVHMSKDLVHSG
jgi:predicted nucleotidyltransferase component of viral defense system